MVNPSAAELCIYILWPFKAGIADAKSSFKNIRFFFKSASPKGTFLLHMISCARTCTHGFINNKIPDFVQQSSRSVSTKDQFKAEDVLFQLVAAFLM